MRLNFGRLAPPLTCSLFSLAFATLVSFSGTASASLVSVSDPNLSNMGYHAEIISAPANVLDDGTTNKAQQGFNEKQNVLLNTDIAVDGGTIAAGTRVSSHMIFLNSKGNALLSQVGVIWEFSTNILGVMIDSWGTQEVATSALLGANGTRYPANPFKYRGFDALQSGIPDAYSIAGRYLTLDLRVIEPGDWIRVITAGDILDAPKPVPLPAAGWLMIGGFSGFVALRRRKNRMNA